MAAVVNGVVNGVWKVLSAALGVVTLGGLGMFDLSPGPAH